MRTFFYLTLMVFVCQVFSHASEFERFIQTHAEYTNQHQAINGLIHYHTAEAEEHNAHNVAYNTVKISLDIPTTKPIIEIVPDKLSRSQAFSNILGGDFSDFWHFIKPDAISLTYGLGEGIDAQGVRISLLYDWKLRWLEWGDWHLNIYNEFSFAYVHDTNPRNGTDSLFVMAATPVFRYEKKTPLLGTITPFFEGAVGLSLLSDNVADGRKLSTLFQFEDHAGVGIRFGSEQQFELKYSIYHYSNASIDSPNQGFNMHWISFTFHF